MRESGQDIRRRADWEGFRYQCSSTIVRVFDAGSDSDGPVSVFVTRTVSGASAGSVITVVAVVNGLGHVRIVDQWLGAERATVRRAVRLAIRETILIRLT